MFVDQHCDATVKSTLPETLREKRDRAIAVEHFETDEHFELSHLRHGDLIDPYELILSISLVGEWLSSRASSPCAFMIFAISQHQP